MKEDREPLRPLVFQILLLLAERELHGYGIMKAVNERARRNVILGPGTLYRTLRQLRDEGLIVESRVESGEGADRRLYRLTEPGREAARREAERMAQLVDRARANALLG